MLSEKLLLRKWKALFSSIIAPLCVCQSICSSLHLPDPAWSPVVRIGSVYEREGLFNPGAFWDAVFLQTALCSTLQWEDTWNFGWACRGSHHCFGSKTVIEAFCVRRNQTPFFFFWWVGIYHASLGHWAMSSLIWICAQALSAGWVFILLCFVGPLLNRLLEKLSPG